MENKIKWVHIKSVTINPNNPRIIKDAKYNKLVKSIRSYPNMLELRPIVIDEAGIILGGNMRYLACKNLGMETIPVLQAKNLTTEQREQFIIADNVLYGEWDWDILSSHFDENAIVEFGVEVVGWSNETYTPEYNPTFNTSDVTQEQVEKRAHEIARDIVRTMSFKSVMCPECSHEFDVN